METDDTDSPDVKTHLAALERLTRASDRLAAGANPDHRSALSKLLHLRVELNAMIQLSIDAGVFTYAAFVQKIVEETDEIEREIAVEDVPPPPHRGKIHLN